MPAAVSFTVRLDRRLRKARGDLERQAVTELRGVDQLQLPTSAPISAVATPLYVSDMTLTLLGRSVKKHDASDAKALLAGEPRDYVRAVRFIAHACALRQGDRLGSMLLGLVLPLPHEDAQALGSGSAEKFEVDCSEFALSLLCGRRPTYTAAARKDFAALTELKLDWSQGTAEYALPEVLPERPAKAPPRPKPKKSKGGRFACEICGESFSKREEALDHIASIHQRRVQTPEDALVDDLGWRNLFRGRKPLS